MKAYVLSIAGVILLSAVVTLVLPNGKMGNSIRAGAKLICLLVLVAPLVSLAQGKGVSESVFIEEDTAYLSACKRLAEEGEEGKIQLLIAQDFSVTAEVDVTCEEKSPFSVKKISVSVKDFGINEQSAHKDIMTKIQNACIKEYACEVTVS